MDTHSRSSALGDGGRDIFGITIGYVPMALAIGATIAELPIDRLAGWVGAPTIAAGAAHVTLVELMAGGAGVSAAVLAAALINLRLVAYSAGLAPWFRGEPATTRLVVGFFTIDPTYLLANQRFTTDDPGRPYRFWYVVGMGAVLYSTWTASVGLGVFVGARIPETLQLESAATFMIIGLLALNLGDRRQRAAAVTGFAVALAASELPPIVTPALAAAAAVAVVMVMADETAHEPSPGTPSEHSSEVVDDRIGS